MIFLEFYEQGRSRVELWLSPSLGEVSTYWNLQWILLRSKGASSIHSDYKRYIFINIVDSIANFCSEFCSNILAIISGCILVWGDASRKDNDFNYRKRRHVKTVDLQKSNITVIIDNEGYIHIYDN